MQKALVNNKPFFSFIILSGLLLSFSAFAQQQVTLKQSLKIAKAENPVLKTAFYNINLAQTDVISARLRPNLVLNNQSLALTNSRYFPEGTGFYNGKNRQTWWQLTKQFRLPSQRKSGIELSEQGVKVEQKNYAELERNLAFDVSNLWLDAWVLRSKLDLYTEAQNNIDSLVKINELRLKNQVITKTDLVRTRLVSEQYKLQTRNVKQNYINSLKDLHYLLGRQDSILVDVSDSADVIELKNLSLDTLLQYGYKNRTDVLAVESVITLSDYDIRYQKTLAYPVPELGMIWNPQNTVPYVGFFGTIQIPLFNRNQGNIARSQTTQQQNRQQLESIKKQITAEIQTAYMSYHTQRENLDRFKEILSESEIVLNSVRYAYLKGGTTIVDFLEAQRSWFDTRQLYYDAVLAYRKSYIELLHSSGLIYQLFE
jgi:cobalt-zinc-cadmium efflux system outer membrane protein